MILDTVMEAETRRRLMRKYALRREDNRIVAVTRLMIREGVEPALILEYIEEEVTLGVTSA